MSYLLQPNLHIVENPAVPPECATENFFAYPEASHLNNCCRPSTMVYGTAPFMGGKGAPHELIPLDDELRPQSTKQFNKKYVRVYEKNMFPLQDMKCSLPMRVHTCDPRSTRADDQNTLFAQRYRN